MVPGVYIDLSAYAGSSITVHLKNRIPLSSFLTLFNLRFFPNWSGKLSIEIYQSYRNLVIAPVIPKTDLSKVAKLIGKHTTAAQCELSKINLGFRRINQSMLNVLKDGKLLVPTAQIFKCNGD